MIEFEDEHKELSPSLINQMARMAMSRTLKPIIVDGKPYFSVHRFVTAPGATLTIEVGDSRETVELGDPAEMVPGSVITVNVEASKMPPPIFFSAPSLSADEADFVSGPTWTPAQQAAMRAMTIMRDPDALSPMPFNRIREMAQPEADDRLDRGARRESRRGGRAEGVGERPVRRHACLLPGYDK